MENFSAQLLDALPCGAALLREGKVVAGNAAARPLLDREQLPEELNVLLEQLEDGCAGSGSCRLDGRDYRVSLSREEAGTRLLSLMPDAPRDGAPAAALADQLRQYLGDLRLALDLLAPTLRHSGEEGAARQFSVLNHSFYRLLRMARHLELTARPDDRPPEPLDLADLCAELVQEAQVLARHAGTALDYDTRLITLPVLGSSEQLRVMVLNLLSNALKAAGSGGTVTLRLGRKGGRAVLTVENGGGQPAQLARLFREEPADPAPGSGLGLGLTLARSIALRHGGTILAAQRERGLAVTVSLPLGKQEAPDRLRTREREEESGFSTVLVELSDALPPRLFDYSDAD